MGLERLQRRGFNVRFTYHAGALLNQDFPEASGELEHVIREIELPITEMVAGGGGEALVTQRLRRALTEIGWRKGIFHVEKTINDRTTFAQSHEVDHVKTFDKGTIALEIEWNNKDPFYDRDLENFNRLHADGAISVGIIVTRGDSLQDGIEAKLKEFAATNAIDSFAGLEAYGIEPTSRQRRAVHQLVDRSGASFGDCWANCFVRDKFGTATTHWAKLVARLDRGVGSPCPIVAIGLPITCIRG